MTNWAGGSLNSRAGYHCFLSAYDECRTGTTQDGACGIGQVQSELCVDGHWTVTSGCFGFVAQGEGECRQGDGAYALDFSLDYGDLTPHTSGTNAAQAQSRCEATCLAHRDWCLAVEVVTRDVWPTPACHLVTDRATFEAAGNTLEHNVWGGSQIIDGLSWQTYCGGTGDCTMTNWAGGSLYPRTGYHCSHVVEN
jgi:hypothetical protein